MIDAVNQLSASSQPTGSEGDDPVGQLSAILGAHLRALQTLDGGAGRLEDKVDEVERKLNLERGRYGVPGRR